MATPLTIYANVICTYVIIYVIKMSDDEAIDTAVTVAVAALLEET